MFLVSDSEKAMVPGYTSLQGLVLVPAPILNNYQRDNKNKTCFSVNTASNRTGS